MLAKSESPCLISDLCLPMVILENLGQCDDLRAKYTSDSSLEHAFRVASMKKQEDSRYLYHMFVPCCQGQNITSSDSKDAVDARHHEGVTVPNCVHSQAYSFDPENREAICAWSYRVVDHYNLPRELVSVSLAYFDRLHARHSHQEATTQFSWCVGMAALSLAVKLHSPKCLDINTLIRLSRDQFNEQILQEMEMTIMRSLEWYLHPPTSTEFSYSILSCLPVEHVSPSLRTEMFEWSKFLAEIAVYDCYFVAIPPSMVALAAVLNVMNDMKLIEQSRPTSLDTSITDIARSLLGAAMNNPNLLAVRSKLKDMADATPSYTPPVNIPQEHTEETQFFDVNEDLTEEEEEFTLPRLDGRPQQPQPYDAHQSPIATSVCVTKP